ncbi:ABC-2 type transport system ATP-binding protein [Arthrobacter pigmenti]|uniref:ABC-2 type transport system ATP-binding protein n=1 Tax=Arthrobacter pigmenti TaxID=271432 RepID=A0A846RRP2_9MICC|nr:ATP-binding cassette domain-containing protein [Arthrobacter pigmenti]NJC20981.1 ABC-2 type transport system ATP-binding protein [Arthrobacter pigmenti]
MSALASTGRHSQDPVLWAHGIHKRFGAHSVLSGVDLDLSSGEVVALLGPNGAGKTTLINILSTLIKPDQGTASIAGIDLLANPTSARRHFSLTGQYAALDDFQSGQENLIMMARLSGLTKGQARERATGLLEAFDLTGTGTKRVSTYSGGMRRRLDLAAGIAARPAALFLDEPTTGLDPQSRHRLWQEIRQLAQDGTAILLTTQYLEEADQLADRILILNGGALIAEGTARELKGLLGNIHQVRFSFGSQEDLDRAAALTQPTAVDPDSWSLTVSTTDTAATIRRILGDLADVTVANIAILQPTLDDVFLTLTQPAHAERVNQPARPAKEQVQ